MYSTIKIQVRGGSGTRAALVRLHRMGASLRRRCTSTVQKTRKPTSTLKIYAARYSTLHTRPSTLNPRPSTLDTRPSTLDTRHSTLDPRPSTLARWHAGTLARWQIAFETGSEFVEALKTTHVDDGKREQRSAWLMLHEEQYTMHKVCGWGAYCQASAGFLLLHVAPFVSRARL